MTRRKDKTGIRYTDIRELTPAILRTFISKIVIRERRHERKTRVSNGLTFTSRTSAP